MDSWEPIHETLYGCLDYHGQVVLSVETIRAAFVEALGGAAFPPLMTEPWLSGWMWPASISLFSPTGWNLRHRIVFEYRGLHHYEPVSGLHPSYLRWQAAQNQLIDDRCTDAELALIVIPYYITHTKLREYIRSELVALGYTLSKPAPVAKFYDTVFQKCLVAKFSDYPLQRK